MLHGVGLTAEQTHTDALVIAPVVRESNVVLETRRLLSLISEAGPQSLMRREAGSRALERARMRAT